MDACSGGGCHVYAVVQQKTSGMSMGRLSNGFGQDEDVARIEVALADLHHIDARGESAIHKLNQEG